ncbi:hypothetical protein CBP31_01450 [Oceanisphaera profunda]|uniref:DUF6969 domain-containing protein n=2 Tax=Oceanisphaera profunda TaxID=1416627 RepID=A0A1Y0D1R3_9GAMM|nr:hypothetical protein CBP31_01450 [Oceanisphaera profunda]
MPMTSSTLQPLPKLVVPVAVSLPTADIHRLREAGAQIRECYRVMSKGGVNIVGEVLKGQGTFFEMTHYPLDDVLDKDSHSQYYYHAHRGGEQEHGHFHTFLRAPAIPAELCMRNYPQASEPWPQGDQAIAHLVAIAMDAWGYPSSLFACNRWVTDESWYPAAAVISMLDNFVIDHANPSWPVNIWLSNMLVLFRPHIEALLVHRDAVIDQWQAQYPEQDIFENRQLEITGQLAISVDDWLAELEAVLV